MDQCFPYKKFDERDSDRYSTVSSEKSKKGRAYVGFDADELRKTSLSDIKQLKISVTNYLKSNSQKYKNSEYLLLYKRIMEELKYRNALKIETTVEAEDDNKNIFLGKKKHFQESGYDQRITIPSFLNDKQIEIKKEIIKESDSSGDSDSSQAKNKKSLIEIINKKCIIKGKLKI